MCMPSRLDRQCVATVVDWNPAGVVILCQYRYGSVRTGLESPLYAIPAIHWLAARHQQLQDIEPQVNYAEAVSIHRAHIIRGSIVFGVYRVQADEMAMCRAGNH